MGVLAKASEAALDAVWGDIGPEPDFDWLRAPEVGTVMVRGRTGATGAAFNLGEMTVTRCSLRLATGEVGHGYVQGRSRERARRAAMADALLQSERAAEVEARVISPLAAALAQARETRAAKAAATKVEFFTLVRGED
jgi:alpha-D-ribose 1-methylphosphonate 5-triphosphate synthase subunit PhnG